MVNLILCLIVLVLCIFAMISSVEVRKIKGKEKKDLFRLVKKINKKYRRYYL